MPSFVQILDFIGTFAFAISGIRLASAKRFDWFGAYIVGLATAIGGGTLRDVMLNVTPVWMTDSIYLICTAFAMFFVIIFGKYLIHLNNTFFLFDSIGLALFTVVGFGKSISLGYPFWVAIIMGSITGAAGGVIRDVFINEIPLIFRKEIYAMACVIGGLVCGVGAGMTLTAGCSGGGEEILGLLCVQKKPDFSVGRIAMILNVFVYGIGLLLFEQDVVVYSIIFGCTTYLTLDRMHLQNVMVTMLIITKSEAMEQLVFRYAGRGVTKWTGVGAYSNEPSDLLLTVVSKKEALHLRKILREEDPNSFIIMDEDVSVAGNFQKRL